MTHAVCISLKIPDNEAYTALVALRRLGVPVDRVERGEIYLFDSDDVDELKRSIVSNERIFNPNKHRLTLLPQPLPREGEVWIESLESPHTASRRAVAWHLFNEEGAPVLPVVLDMAIERLLLNPAIDRAITARKAQRAGDK